MSFVKHIPNIFYNLTPNGMEIMDPNDKTNHVQTHIKDYGKNLDRNSNIPLKATKNGTHITKCNKFPPNDTFRIYFLIH